MTALEYKANIKKYMLMLMIGISIYFTISKDSIFFSFLWILAGGLYLLINKRESSILMLIFVIPFEMWLPVNTLLFLAFIIEVLKKKKIERIFMGIAMIFVLVLMQSIFSTNGNVAIIIKVISVWISVFYFIWQQFSDDILIKICQAFRWSGIIYSLDLFLISWKHAGIYILESRFGGGQLAPFLPEYIQIPSENVIGLVMALSLISTLLEMFYTGRKKYLCLIWFVGIGILTKSTTFLILFLFMNICYYIYFSPKDVTGILQIGMEFLILCVGLITMNYIYPDFFGYFISRFSLSDKSNGRNVIFNTYNQNFMKGNVWNILFGYGTQNLDVMGNGGGLHNGIQGWYIQYGFVGFFVILILLVFLIRNAYVRKFSKESFCVSALPFLIMLLGIQTMNVSFIFYLPVLLMLNLSRMKRGKGNVYNYNWRRIC